MLILNYSYSKIQIPFYIGLETVCKGIKTGEYKKSYFVVVMLLSLFAVIFMLKDHIPLVAQSLVKTEME